MVPLRAAISFLTVFPGAPGDVSPSQLNASRAYYPAVGLLLGLLLVGLEEGLTRVVPVYLTGAILVVVLVVATRGFHLDGLMDTCDGLFGGYTRERRLEIMRDPHVGAFAAAGAASIILLKWAALVSLLSLAESEKVWGLLLFPVISRWGMVVAIASFPYARDQGLGSVFHGKPHLPPTLIAGGTALAASLLAAGGGGLALFAVGTVLAWLLGRWMTGLLGGLTGDTYGAINEVVEVGTLAVAVALIPHGLAVPLYRLI